MNVSVYVSHSMHNCQYVNCMYKLMCIYYLCVLKYSNSFQRSVGSSATIDLCLWSCDWSCDQSSVIRSRGALYATQARSRLERTDAVHRSIYFEQFRSKINTIWSDFANAVETVCAV